MCTMNQMKKNRILDAKCINCKYYVKYKQHCKKHKMKTTKESFCMQIERKDIYDRGS